MPPFDPGLWPFGARRWHAQKKRSAARGESEELWAARRQKSKVKTVTSQRSNDDVGHQDSMVVGRQDSMVVGRQDSIVVGRQDSIVVGRQDSMVVGRQDSMVVGSRNTLLRSDCIVLRHDD